MIQQTAITSILMIQYSIDFEQANEHLFNVQLKISIPLSKKQVFYLPNWIPGSYMIRDFARNIVTLTASSAGQAVNMVKLDKSSWQLEQEVDNLEINYQVYAWDLSVRSAHLDNQHGFFNGTSMFLGIRGFENQVHDVTLKASKLAISNQWQVATAMPAKEVDSNGFGLYSSADYDELIDHPFEFAKLELVTFEVFDIPHKMYFTEAPARVDWQRIGRDVKKICETEVQFFGDEQPPFSQYVFMTFVQKKGFGGLEHMASTALHCSFEDLPLIGEDSTKISNEYRTFLSLCCHEYFHCWNVKRIKPARFIPMDMSREVHTELLWFFEGITSYYDELLMVRAGVIDACSYLDMLAQTITRVTKGTGRLKQSVTESSFDTWTKFYKQDENAINSIVSYYTKGALVALSLDFEIRKRTKNRHSLDDLMRLIWRKHGKTGRGLGENQVIELAEEIVGESLKDFFDIALYTTEELDLTDVFNQVGVNYQLISPYLSSEKGGYINEAKVRKAVSSLGVVHKDNNLGAQIHSVMEKTSGAIAGLSNADIIIAIDHVRVTSKELDSVIARIPPGTEITISYFRRERLYHCQCILAEGDSSICYLSFQNGQKTPALLDWLGIE